MAAWPKPAKRMVLGDNIPNPRSGWIVDPAKADIDKEMAFGILTAMLMRYQKDLTDAVAKKMAANPTDATLGNLWNTGTAFVLNQQATRIVCRVSVGNFKVMTKNS